MSVTGFYTVGELTQVLPNFPKSTPDLQSPSLLGGGNPADWNQSLDFSAARMLKDLSLCGIPLYPSILGLRSLTGLRLTDRRFKLHLDTLLDFLEANHSLESVGLGIGWTEPSLRCSWRQTPIGNQLRRLSIFCDEAADGRALISNIPLPRGAALEIHYGYPDVTLTAMLSGVSLTHLSNLPFPTFMEYQTFPRTIRLLGPNGSFLYDGNFSEQRAFQEFPLLPLGNIRKLRLKYRKSLLSSVLRLSSFPSLEVLVIDSTEGGVPLSTALPDPTCSSLNTLAFLDCVITESFITELTQFAFRRGGPTSASLHRVVIIGSSDEHFPQASAASIARLREHVPVVEVMEGSELSMDLL